MTNSLQVRDLSFLRSHAWHEHNAIRSISSGYDFLYTLLRTHTEHDMTRLEQG
ncbi:predicted protein [Sclerotinia sclerotiorum 1980 UF-70]|uniref:Uncharacterized protein n=1 Tax=Sclerotinia sclerotiorum (strain ATCC 18683 / 1980 / Ss-1) TaxID=665079 RepID=A7EKA6_SCLS1|nr:predicted protein [Sclerotinia sclerotiorum 1980 UF-70]EDO03272.1 predicted protein [Sclerotinia sclerotiorum 1980 UF-70]